MDQHTDRIRKEHGPKYTAVLGLMALNIMPEDPTKASLRGKLNIAACSEAYLTSLLAPL